MKTKVMITKLGCTLLIYTLISSLLKAEIHRPQLQIPLIKTAPVIDGKLTDASWQNSAELSEFVNWARNDYIKDKVMVFLCYDEKNLYIAFRNHDPEAGSLNTTVDPKGPRDTFLWGRNHTMVGIRHRDVYIQLMADPKGTMTDWKNNDITWNGNWLFGAAINQSDWTAEFMIPLSDLGLNETAAMTELDVTLSRSFPNGESSGWSGKCNLASQTNAQCVFDKWARPVPGWNQLNFIVQNFGNEILNIECELELIPLDGKPEFINQTGQGPSSDFQLKVSSEPMYYRSGFSVPAGGSIKEKIGFNLPAEGSYFASAVARSKDGTIIRRNVDYWFSIAQNSINLAVLKERIGESIASMTRLSNPIAMQLKAAAEKILSEIQYLESYADTAWRSGRWDELTETVEKMDLRVTRHLHEVRWAALHHWKREDDFGIAMTHSILKLRKDRMFPVPLADNIELSLARNEYESFQLAILPFGREIGQFSVEVSDLTGKDGSIIHEENIKVSLVDYHHIEWQADYAAKYRGWHPDPLIPIENGIKIGDQDVCRPLWITVYAPAGTKAGEYNGTIQISAEGSGKVTAYVKCRVWDFELPVASHLKTHSWDQIEYLKDFYNLEEYPIEWYQEFCGLLLRNRLNPGSAGVNYVSQTPDSAGAYDFSEAERVLGYCIERGLTRFSMIQMKKGIYAPEEAEKAYAFVAAYAKFLKQKGWLDKALVELWDEPTDLEWPYIKARAERLKQIDPGLRLQLFAEGGPYDFWDKNTDRFGLNDLVDIWAPVNIVESPETQANGGEIWTYFCTLARESAPNFFIDCPAIYQRSIAWYCWMYGVDGFEHWSSTYFWRNTLKGKPMDQKWPNVPWDARTYYYFNGEGQLVYPGPDGIPYSSIRLENFRDGMDDYEYLFRLRELISRNENNTIDQELNEFRRLLSPEEYLLYKYPREIKMTLENTLCYPDQPERILETRQKIAMAIEKLQKR